MPLSKLSINNKYHGDDWYDDDDDWFMMMNIYNHAFNICKGRWTLVGHSIISFLYYTYYLLLLVVEIRILLDTVILPTWSLL